MSSPHRSLVWWATLVVAACGVIATAHGLWAVAHAARQPWLIAALYPPATDGLALVAYFATTRLATKAARRYAWVVVVMAAGLSGFAQAVYLGRPLEDLTTLDWRLRFGVGYWPAVAVLFAAHLLWLVGRGQEPVAEAFAEEEEQEAEPDTSEPDLLLLEAQAVAAHLGDKLSRRSLIAGLRERGHPVSTTRATELLNRLRDAA